MIVMILIDLLLVWAPVVGPVAAAVGGALAR
jgi:hypothetical protein